MSKNQVVGCPSCGSRISFRQFILLNNFSAINCDTCHARVEISNRDGNAVIAAVSGVVSAATIVFGAYIGKQHYNSFGWGLAAGIGLATLFVVVICRILYKRSQLHQNVNTRPMHYCATENSIAING
jgi:peptidoglycan/LPS O-acetylase OafA/YrhL